MQKMWTRLALLRTRSSAQANAELLTELTLGASKSIAVVKFLTMSVQVALSQHHRQVLIECDMLQEVKQ